MRGRSNVAAAGWAILLLCVLVAAGPTKSSCAPLRVQAARAAQHERQLLDSARELLNQKDYAGAARLYQQILQGDPSSFEALSNLGVADAGMDKYVDAARAYQHALRLQPKSFPVLLNLGLCYFKAGDFKSAANYLERAVSIQTDSFQARSLLAMSYYSQKEFVPASRRFEKLIAVEPDNTTVQYLLAESYLWSGQEQHLLDFFGRVLERSPNSVTVHMLVGEAEDSLGRTSEAIKEFQAAVALAPKQPNVHFGLGYLYWEQRQYDRATVEFRREIEAGGSVAKSQAYLGDIALRGGIRGQARAFLREAEQSYSKYWLTHYDLGVLAAEDKEYDEATSEFQQAIGIDPDRAEAHYRLAEVLRAQGKTAMAEKELKKVAQIQEGTRQKLLQEISGTAPSAAPN